MPLFWFLVGMSTTVAIICVLLPWLRTIPRFDTLPALPWQAPLVGVLMIGGALGLYRWLGRPDIAPVAPVAQLAPQGPALARARAPIGADSTLPPSAGTASAGSMQSAVASLEARLAKSGGSADDWELLAKSYEFIGRPEAAARARQHELPNGDNAGGGAPVGIGAAVGVSAAVGGGAAVSGEVSLSSALLTKAPAGSTLFIVATSVDSPGAPVAALRSSVFEWPVKFTLDDSNSMLPGQNLSSVGRVTIEARISQSGQALPARGDLRGSSGVINASRRAPVKIVIDEVIQ